MLEPLRLLLAVGLLVVGPGFLLVQAAFPPGRVALTRLERGYLTVAAGVLLLMAVGVILGLLPYSGRGWFQTVATGAPYLELALLAVCVPLFYLGLARGSYPRLAARFPRLARPEGQSGAHMR